MEKILILLVYILTKHYASNGMYDQCFILVDYGCNVNFLTYNTALHCASLYGHENICKFLIEHGADSSIKDKVTCVFFLVGLFLFNFGFFIEWTYSF
jgi:hypothetical protein